MRASFNVLDQAWIPVISLEGKEETLGIRETILRAQELREITSASPLEEYSLYRFLGLFLMDMLPLKARRISRTIWKTAALTKRTWNPISRCAGPRG